MSGKVRVVILISLCCLSLQAQTLVDKEATAETKALYRNLSMLAGKHILFGQQDATNYGHGWSIGENRSDVKDVCGSHPAMVGDDFATLTSAKHNRLEKEKTRLLKTITDTYKRGGVVTVCWHSTNPVNGGSFYYEKNPIKAVSEILPGGEAHQQYLLYLDRIAEVAHEAKGEDGELIPIIFRPFHEFDGDWFWWGNPYCSQKEFVRLWRFTIDYLKDKKKVHNFLYAFSPDCRFTTKKEYLERYPGDKYVDILGMDNYWDFRPDGANNPKLAEAKLKIVSDIAKKKHKLAALTETGLEGVTNPEWYTTILLPILKNPAITLSYVMVWRNANYNPNHYYAPFPGHPAENDFRKFKESSLIYFEDRLPDLYK